MLSQLMSEATVLQLLVTGQTKPPTKESLIRIGKHYKKLSEKIMKSYPTDKIINDALLLREASQSLLSNYSSSCGYRNTSKNARKSVVSK
jgi:hypothetical protein